MSHDFLSARPETGRSRHDLANLKALLPHLWQYRGRVLLALGFLILAKAANVGVPLVLKGIVDALDVARDHPAALPVALLLGYGALRMASSLFNELRDVVFARVRFHAMRGLTIATLEHLYRLSLRFHLERRTGAISRDLERGSRSLSTLLNYLIFNIIPTAVEFLLVFGVLLVNYDWIFSGVIALTVVLYVAFTFAITNWRMKYRHEMNELDSRANNEAMDGLINYETVKYFGNEALETRRTDATLNRWEDVGVLSQTSMSLLNFGQGAIIAVGVTVMMFMAAARVQSGALSLGDLVLVNAFLLQVFMPLGFLGIVYRQVKYALVDMDLLVKLLEETPEIRDDPKAAELKVERGEVRFEGVDFAYNPQRQVLFGIDFTIPPGRKVAVVGPSGAGKSTLARLLFRFYDVGGGKITLDGQDLRQVTQQSLREKLAIVPQDTVLFNDTLYYNLSYPRPGAGREEVEAAARIAQLHDFIQTLPEGYDTVVGERGLKLSGGEKQRVAIARAVLKGAPVMVFDEATSSLDSHAEQAILQALRAAAARHTTLVIAHRLSTIVDADQILVMEGGRIVERGSHQQLLEQDGVYAQLWALQQKERESLLE